MHAIAPRAKQLRYSSKSLGANASRHYNVGAKSGGKMPHVQVTWVAGRTPEEKKKLVQRITEELVEDGRAKTENIHVSFVDVPPTDYAEGGVLVSEQKRNP